MATYFDIEGGPSKWDFILSLADGEQRNRRVVQFQYRAKRVKRATEGVEVLSFKLKTLECVIESIARMPPPTPEDHWVAEVSPRGRYPIVLAQSLGFVDRIRIQYSTKTRRGFFLSE